MIIQHYKTSLPTYVFDKGTKYHLTLTKGRIVYFDKEENSLVKPFYFVGEVTLEIALDTLGDIIEPLIKESESGVMFSFYLMKDKGVLVFNSDNISGFFQAY